MIWNVAFFSARQKQDVEMTHEELSVLGNILHFTVFGVISTPK